MNIKCLNLIQFGKFSNTTIDLTNGINIIEGNNEAGKSTIATFVRFMLFGMPSARVSKSNPIPERDRYIPWGNDNASGSMELVWNGKRILIEREYRKGSNKKAVVRSKDTGVILDEFIGAEPGEIMLNMKADTFDKTAFIRQNEIELTESEELETKLRNLVSGGEEDISFINTQKTIDNYIKKLEGSRSGLINDIDKRLAVLKEELREATNTYDSWIIAQKQYLETVKNEEQLAKQLEKIGSEYEGVRANVATQKLNTINECIAGIKEFENSLKAITEQLNVNGHIPNAEYINKIKKLSNDYQLAKERYFLCKEDVKIAQKNYDEKKLLENEYNNIDNIEEKVRNASNKPKSNFLFAAIFSLVAMVISLFVYLISKADIAIVFSIVSGLLGALFLITHFTSKKKTNADKIALQYGYTNAQKVFLASEDYNRLKAEIEINLKSLNKVKEREDQLKVDSEKIQNELASLCALRGLKDATVSAAEILCNEIESLINRKNGILGQIDSLNAKLSGLTQGTNLEELIKLSKLSNNTVLAETNDIEQKLSTLRNDYSQAKVNTIKALNFANSFFANTKTPNIIQTEMNELSQKKKTLRFNKSALELANSLLGEAFSDLQKVFAPQLNKEAEQIFSSMTGNNNRRMLINTKNEVYISDNGITRELCYYSTGTKDAAYLSVRLAVAKLIFGNEKPVIIFDDTFAHFDLERLKLAMNSVSEIGKDFQIILLTCRDNEQKTGSKNANIIKILKNS